MSYLNRTIYMPVELLEAFSRHTGLFWSSLEIEGAICDAMEAAMKPQPGQAQAQALQDATASGYQWKQVFLPEGTVLRASFDRQPYYAVVEGVAIKYGEYSLSPSAFANLQGSGNRNAWKAVWLRFPGCPDWVRADKCREVRRARTARLFEPAQPGESGSPEAKPVRHVGCHEQRYTDDKPSKDNAIPLHKLQLDFPEIAESTDVAGTAWEADHANAVPVENPPGVHQPLPPAAAVSQPGMKPNKRRQQRPRKRGKHGKHGKRGRH